MRSSYAENNFGRVFFGLIEAFRPVKVIECGILDGYSTLWISKGIKCIREKYNVSPAHLDAYDLWDGYEFKHGNKDEVQKMLESEGVADCVTLHEGDAYEVHKNYEDKSIHFLHIDISNDGHVLRRILPLWQPKMQSGAVFAFEGGSEERDQVDWMVKYKKEPIAPEIERNPVLQKYYVYGVYRKFPSLLVAVNKFGE